MNRAAGSRRNRAGAGKAWPGALAAWATVSLAADRLWAEGTAEAARVYNVADSRGMEAGPSKWIADVYNTSSWQYAVLVVAVMALMGLLLGYGTDRLLRLLRLNLGPLDHHE